MTEREICLTLEKIIVACEAGQPHHPRHLLNLKDIHERLTDSDGTPLFELDVQERITNGELRRRVALRL